MRIVIPLLLLSLMISAGSSQAGGRHGRGGRQCWGQNGSGSNPFGYQGGSNYFGGRGSGNVLYASLMLDLAEMSLVTRE